MHFSLHTDRQDIIPAEEYIQNIYDKSFLHNNSVDKLINSDPMDGKERFG